MGSCLSSVVLLLSSGECDVDLLERWVENLARELLQVVVEGMGVEQLEDRSHKEGEGSSKWEANIVR